jgi:biotin-(acetyl-CoA carboxylase) ligase
MCYNELRGNSEMIDQESVKQITQATVVERIQMIELILESLKHDMKTMGTEEPSQLRPFKIRQFDLGKEVHVERDSIYAERSLRGVRD